MATRDERTVLEILEEEGGQSNEVKIARSMALRLDYVRTILGSMGRRDFIDILASGKIRLAEKGWKVLGKTPSSSFGGMAPSGPPESPEKRYKRWMKGEKPKEEKSQEKEEKKNAVTLLKEFSLESEELENLSPQEKFERWTG